MATTLHDVLHSMLEDAQRYHSLARKANGSFSERQVAGPDAELVSGALEEIERLSHSQAREAERLLAERTVG